MKPTSGDAIETEQSPEEKAKIEAFIRGDMDGFKFVYARYRQRVFSYCRYYMGDQATAEDAFQEVFSRAYTRREQLRETKALKSWLLLITRSVCLNMLRTSKFKPEFVSLDHRPAESPEFKELTTSGDQNMVEEDFKQALANLAPIYRDAFLLREFEGYEYEEIARLTSTNVMNVKVRITRAKRKLRAILMPHEVARRAKKGRTDIESIHEEECGLDNRQSLPDLVQA